MRRAKAPFLSGCESPPATVVCGRLPACQAFLSRLVLTSVLSRLSATTERRARVSRLLSLNEGQPSGWPARASRTVGRGSHPQGRNEVEEPRSGLTAAVDRARGTPPSAARAIRRICPSDGLVHAVRCSRVSGLVGCGISPAAGLYGDTRVGSKIAPVCSKAPDSCLVFPTPSR